MWNEAWMSRPDLAQSELVEADDEGDKYTKPGWQVLDATPQETSDGKYKLFNLTTLIIENVLEQDKKP